MIIIVFLKKIKNLKNQILLYNNINNLNNKQLYNISSNYLEPNPKKNINKTFSKVEKEDDEYLSNINQLSNIKNIIKIIIIEKHFYLIIIMD